MRAYFVLGPESSGNRYLHRLLLSAGCEPETGCDPAANHYPFDLAVPSTFPELLALVRSVPHGGYWPNPVGMACRLTELGYHTTFLCPRRDPLCVASSQVRVGHVHTLARGLAAHDHFWDVVFWRLDHALTDVVVVPYQALGDPGYRERLRLRLGLPQPFAEPFADGDQKYREAH